MKRSLAALLSILLLLMGLVTVPAQAQVTTTAVNPNANISWPPPIYLLHGLVAVRGTANVPNMSNYFISFQPLNDDLSPAGEYLPAALLSSRPVQDNTLGVWDTTLVDDGLYMLRLTVNVRGGRPVTHTVGPIRVENNPPPYAQVQFPGGQISPTTVPIFPTQVPIFPTQVPFIPTPTYDPTPRGTVRTQTANVRQGDSTEYVVLTSLPQGQTVRIVGLSARGTGWFYVQLINGLQGWMAPSVIDVTGNLVGLPLIQPPPLPATPTPIPTATPIFTPVPPNIANLVAGIFVFDPPSPTCAQTFTVGFDVANQGFLQTATSGTVSLVDTRVADGSIQGSTIGGFPILLPGQTFRVNMPITISTWYNETHRITLTIDPGNLILESNEADNVRVVEYTLQRGGCP